MHCIYSSSVKGSAECNVLAVAERLSVTAAASHFHEVRNVVSRDGIGGLADDSLTVLC